MIDTPLTDALAGRDIPGVGSAFTSLVAYIAVQLAIFGFFGAIVSAEMADKFGIEWSWWIWTLFRTSPTPAEIIPAIF